MAGNLLDANARDLLRPGGPLGPLLEGFVLMELARQLTWSRRQVELFHYLVLYTGTQTLLFGPRLRAVPAGALWEITRP